MGNKSSKTKVVSCRVSLEMYDLIKKCDINLYDALIEFLSKHTEKELIQCYLTEYEQKLSELNKEQVEVEKKINELKERLNHEDRNQYRKRDDRGEDKNNIRTNNSDTRR